MRDAASYRRQAEACYDLSRRCDDALERLGYVLTAMECKARAVDLDNGRQLPVYMIDPDRDREGA